MRLGDFILANIDAILTAWEEFARATWPGSASVDPLLLRDHAEEMLRATAADMASDQTLAQQASKSRGEGGGGSQSAVVDRAAVAHGSARHDSGFDLAAVIAEYRALRASVIRLWRESNPAPDSADLDDLTRFHEAIDQSLTEAVVEFTRIVEQNRHQRELTVRESERRFRALAQATTDVIYCMNADWTEMRRLDGRQFIADTLEPNRAWREKYIPPDDQPIVLAAIQQAIQSRAVFELEHRIIRVDQSLGWTWSRAIPILDDQGKILEWFGTASDITPRKNAEQALRESEDRFRMIADHIDQLAWTSEELGCPTWFNQRWLDFTGLSLEEAKEGGWRKAHHPEHVDRVVASISKSRAAGRTWEETFPLRGKDGRYRWFLSRAQPIRNEQGQIIRWFGTNTDITERLEAEEHLRLVMAELNHRVKNTLAAIDAVAHQTIRHSASLEEFQTAFSQRLRALAQAHSLLTQAQWQGAALRDLIERELGPRCGHDGQMEIQGPAITLPPQAALAMHMVIHELCTNAAKYGALSSGVGKVRVEWSLRAGPRYPELALRWTECGGPPVVQPTKKGFGSRVLDSTIAFELDGDLRLDFRESGLVCELSFPLKEADRSEGLRSVPPVQKLTHPLLNR